MTKEEAAEIILGGEPWRDCDACSGCGYSNPRMKKFCKSCKGIGRKLKLKHRYAYMKLRMTAPTDFLQPLARKLK
jgi:DnaJ-class molecular chaperone